MARQRRHRLRARRLCHRHTLGNHWLLMLLLRRVGDWHLGLRYWDCRLHVSFLLHAEQRTRPVLHANAAIIG